MSTGSFGLVEEKGLKLFLKRLQEDQQDMLELIKQREKSRKKGKDENALPNMNVPGPAVTWDVGQGPSPMGIQNANPQFQPQFEASPIGALLLPQLGVNFQTLSVITVADVLLLQSLSNLHLGGAFSA